MQNPYSPIVRGLYSFEGPATYLEILAYVIYNTGGRPRELHNIIMSSLEYFIQLGQIRRVFNENTYMLMPDFESFLESFYYMERVNRPQIQEEENNVMLNQDDEIESVEQRVGRIRRQRNRLTRRNVRMPINILSNNGGIIIRDSTTRRRRVVTRSVSNRNRTILNIERTVRNRTVTNSRAIVQNNTVERHRSSARNLITEVGNRTDVRSNLTSINQRVFINGSTTRSRRFVRRKTANRASTIINSGITTRSRSIVRNESTVQNCRTNTRNRLISRNLATQRSNEELTRIREVVSSFPIPRNRVLTISRNSMVLRNRLNTRNTAENHAFVRNALFTQNHSGASNARNQTTTRIRPITRSCELPTSIREVVRSPAVLMNAAINRNLTITRNRPIIRNSAVISNEVTTRNRTFASNAPTNSNVLNCANQRTIEHATVSRNLNIRYRQNITNFPVSRPRTTTCNYNIVRRGNTFRTGRIVKRAINNTIARKQKVAKQRASNRDFEVVNRAPVTTQNVASITQNVESITQNVEEPTTITLRTRSNESTNRHHAVTKRGITTANSEVVKRGRVSKNGRIVKRRSC